MSTKNSEEVDRCLRYADGQGYHTERRGTEIRLSYDGNSVVLDKDDPNAVLLAITFLQNLKAAKAGRR